MEDREKVLTWLEICGKNNECSGYCPYSENGFGKYGQCRESLMADAYDLLKEQKPRVVTLDELTKIYVEFKGDNCPIRLINFDLQKIIMHMDNGICRLWTDKPTDEQRKAVKWE